MVLSACFTLLGSSAIVWDDSASFNEKEKEHSFFFKAIYFLFCSVIGIKFGHTGFLLVPKQICSAKKKSPFPLLLQSLLKSIGKATVQHWTERTGREKRKELGIDKDRGQHKKQQQQQ